MFQQCHHVPILKIAIIRSSAIGDVVLATSLLDMMSKLPIKWEVTWLGKGSALQLIKDCWPTIHIHDIDQPRHKTFQHIKDCHFIVDLQNNPRSMILSKYFSLMTKRKTYSAPKFWVRRRMLVSQSYLQPRSSVSHTKDLTWNFHSMLNTLQTALKDHLPIDLHHLIMTTKAHPNLPVSHLSNCKNWNSSLNGFQWLAIAPGASYTPKQAPVQLFTRVLEELFQKIPKEWHKNFGVVFIGARHERAQARQILDSLSWTPHSLNLVGELSLVETATLLSHCQLLLGNDSAPAHIAEAVGVPTSVLFGPTTEQFGFAPHLKASRAFSVPLGCQPCSLHGKSPCRFNDYLCYQGIQPGAVAEHIMGQLWRSNIPKSETFHSSSGHALHPY